MNFRVLYIILLVLPFANNAFSQVPYKIDDKWYLVDQNTKNPLIDAAFDEIITVDGNPNLFIAAKGNDHFILDASKKQKSESYQQIMYQSNTFMVQKDDQFGLLNLNQKDIMPFVYTNMRFLNTNTHHLVIATTSKSGLFDLKGQQLLDTICDDIYFENDIIHYKYKKPNSMSWAESRGFLDQNGHFFKGFEDVERYYFSNLKNWISCYINKKQRLLNIDTRQVIDAPKGFYISNGINFNDQSVYFFIQNERNTGLINVDEKIVVPANYQIVSPSDSKIQFMSSKTEALIINSENGALKIEKVRDFKIVSKDERKHTYFYGFKLKNTYQLVDESMKQIGTETYKSLESVESHIFAQNLLGKYGLIDNDAEIIIPFIHDNAYDDWRYIKFKKGDEYLLYTEQGERIFPNQKITGFNDGLYDVDDNHIVFLTGNTGVLVNIPEQKIILENVLSVIYNEDMYYSTDIQSVIIKTGAGDGIFSLTSGKYIIEPNIDEIKIILFAPSEKTLLILKDEGKYNLFDPQTNELLFESYIDKIAYSYESDVIKCYTKTNLYLVSSEYNEIAIRLIKLDLNYKNCLFNFDYDLQSEKHKEIFYRVHLGGKIGILKENGEWLHKPELDDYDPSWQEDEYLIVVKNKLNYILKSDGSYLTPQGFELIEFLGTNDGKLAIGYLGAKEYIILENGTVVEKVDQ